jgi:hypothetical protein
MVLRRRPCFNPEETASVQHFSSSISRRTAEQAHFSIPITAFDLLTSGIRRTVLILPRSSSKSDPKQILFVTSAFPSLPSMISGMVAQAFTKRISKIWNSSEILAQASRRSNSCSIRIARTALCAIRLLQNKH